MTLAKFKVDSVILEGKASDPATGSAGEMIYNSTEETPKIYNGAEWIPAGAKAIPYDECWVSGSYTAGSWSVSSPYSPSVSRGVWRTNHPEQSIRTQNLKEWAQNLSIKKIQFDGAVFAKAHGGSAYARGKGTISFNGTTLLYIYAYNYTLNQEAYASGNSTFALEFNSDYSQVTVYSRGMTISGYQGIESSMSVTTSLISDGTTIDTSTGSCYLKLSHGYDQGNDTSLGYLSVPIGYRTYFRGESDEQY